MLYFIGLGLGDENDITLKGLHAVQSCARVYLEAYTSILSCSKERLVCFNIYLCVFLSLYHTTSLAWVISVFRKFYDAESDAHNSAVCEIPL